MAAEIATVAPQFFNKMIFVGAMGIKPEHGEIFGYFLEGGLTGLRRAFHRPEQSPEFIRYWGRQWTPEEADLVEQHPEMTCRIAPHLASPAAGVVTPTLLVWGHEDAITPLKCGENLSARHAAIAARRDQELRSHARDGKAGGIRAAGPRLLGRLSGSTNR